jgi:hypothetical protein
MADSCTCSCAPTRRRRPTATFVIATLALFMSLGGTSYAAVKAKSIGTKQLKDSSVTSAKIARAGVTASDIRANVIDGSKVRAGSIGSQHILDGSIGSLDIADGSIGAQDIQPGSIGAREIAANSINAQQIADQSLGLGELNQATVDLFRDVPTELVLVGGQNSAVQGMPATGAEPSTTSFTTVRSYSVPAAGTGKTGTSLVQSTIAVSSASAANVSCWITVGPDGSDPADATIVATATATTSAYAIIPVTALVNLPALTVVETRCRADGAATADTRTATGATSMTLMRVDD